MAYSALAVANAFIELSKRDDITVTNMKLQKLVYFAHGFALALNHEELFKEPIHAFQWGPVIPELYNAVKHYGSGRITEQIPIPFGEPEIDLDSPNDIAAIIVKSVWKKYGKYTAAQLSTLTHLPGTPWNDVWSVKEYGVIPNDLIRSYYKTFLKKAA
jgi:uncharacterized phage-associated protein